MTLTEAKPFKNVNSYLMYTALFGANFLNPDWFWLTFPNFEWF